MFIVSDTKYEEAGFNSAMVACELIHLTVEYSYSSLNFPDHFCWKLLDNLKLRLKSIHHASQSR